MISAAKTDRALKQSLGKLRLALKDRNGNGDLWWEEAEKQSAGTEVTSCLSEVLVS